MPWSASRPRVQDAHCPAHGSSLLSLHQRSSASVCADRMLDHPVTTIPAFSDLHRRRPRHGLHLPQEHRISVSPSSSRNLMTQHEHRSKPRNHGPTCASRPEDQRGRDGRGEQHRDEGAVRRRVHDVRVPPLGGGAGMRAVVARLDELAGHLREIGAGDVGVRDPGTGVAAVRARRRTGRTAADIVTASTSAARTARFRRRASRRTTLSLLRPSPRDVRPLAWSRGPSVIRLRIAVKHCVDTLSDYGRGGYARAMASTTQPRRKVRERREDVRNRVLRAATEMMADGTPYTELPVQRIAARADVARSTFYLHFPDKSLADRAGRAGGRGAVPRGRRLVARRPRGRAGRGRARHAADDRGLP